MCACGRKRTCLDGLVPAHRCCAGATRSLYCESLRNYAASGVHIICTAVRREGRRGRPDAKADARTQTRTLRRKRRRADGARTQRRRRDAICANSDKRTKVRPECQTLDGGSQNVRKVLYSSSQYRKLGMN